MSLYGLILGIGFLVAFSYFQKHTTLAARLHQRLFFGLLISGILGARLYHVLDQHQYYLANPNQLFNLHAGGLGIYGALLAGFLFILVFVHHHQLKLLPLLDQIATVIPLAQAIGRWGNYVNLEVYGQPTYTNLGQYIPYHLRPIQFQNYNYFHPVWLYESILCALLFYLLNRQSKCQLYLYLLGYGLIRFVLEFLRFDTWQISGLKIAQILSLALILLGLLPILRLNTKKTTI